MDSNLERTIVILEPFNQVDKLDCLKAYAQSLDLVEWLRREAKSLSELKVLVDMASMTSVGSAEQGIDKTIFAKSLKEAGSAFASLIYELKCDDGFFQFMNLCEKVCSHLDTDKRIAEKLLGVKDKVPLLEEIKKRRGQVESNALNDAKILNQFGVYKIDISASLKSKINLLDSSQIKISDLINLEIESKPSKRYYKFEDLEELQNILMLVAPRKSKNYHRSKSSANDSTTSDLVDQEDESETLEYFIEIFSRVIRLAEIYLKLANCSCLFFENCQVKVYCDIFNNRLDKLKEPCLVLSNLNNFFQVATTTKPKPKPNSSIENRTDTLSALNSVCSILEDTYEIWCTFISMLRDKYNYLNYFTISQIKYLYTHLNRFIIGNLKSAKAAWKQAETTIEFEIISSMMYNISSNLSMEKLLKAYEQTLKLQQEDVNQIEIEKLNLKSDSNENVFFQKYKESWSSFINEQNSLKLVERKHLSFTQLIVFLDFLTKNNDPKLMLTHQRKIPGYLNTRGNPNLILCPARDQIPIVLSMYAYYPVAALPTNDEILFCDAMTSSDQVENFLRIAFMSQGERIYTLMNIQELTYENSTIIEKFWLSYKNKTDSYILVLVCCQEKQAQSILASVFSKNRIKPIKLPSTDLEEYLFTKLVVPYDSNNILSNFDPDSSVIRTFLSQRSGNGKSTYIKLKIQEIAEEKRSLFNYQIVRIKASKLNIEKEI
jgi:hypothetical protein